MSKKPSDKEKKTTVGRKHKASVEELKSVILKYFVARSGESSDALGVRDICARLEHFAREEGIITKTGKPFKSSDFRREEARAYIAELREKAHKEISKVVAIPAFVDMNFDALSRRSKEECLKVFQQRDAYYQNVLKKAAIAIESYVELSENHKKLLKEIARITIENQELQEKNSVLSGENRTLAENNVYYKNFIRKKLTPKEAEDFLKKMKRSADREAKLMESATKDISSVIKNDRRLRRDPDTLDDFFK